MTPFVVPVVAALLSGMAGSVCEAPFSARNRERAAAPSLIGVPGLFEVPAAVSAPEFSGTLAFNSLNNLDDYGYGAAPQRNGFISVGFVPRVTLVARATVHEAPFARPIRDISAGGQLLVASEQGWRPSFALGVADINGNADLFVARYGVATRSFGRARVSAGWGNGHNSLDGFFGGVEIAPCRWISLIAENDARRRNAGVRLAPLGAWGEARGVEPTIDLLWREGQGQMAGIGLRIQAGDGGFHRAGQAVRETPATAPPQAAREAPLGASRRRGAPLDAAGLRDALVGHGFENVRVATRGDTLDIAYENRVFNREEWEALGVVMGEAARVSATNRVVRATILHLDLPVVRVASGVEAFGRLLDGAIDEGAFAAQLVIDHPSELSGDAGANPSRFRADFTVRPRIEALPLVDMSVWESRSALVPQVAIQLGRGLSVTGQRAYLAHRTSQFPTQYVEFGADQLLVHFARPGRIPGFSTGGALSQLSLGRFGTSEVGASYEFDVNVNEDRVTLRGIAAVFGKTFDALRRSVALGTIRYRYAPMGMVASLTAGRFLHGDAGASAELERRFGLMELAFFLQATDEAKMAGARFALPLMFGRDLKPAALRVRMPGYYDTHKRTQVFAPLNVVRPDVAQPLETGQDLFTAFRGRDRLNAEWLRAQVALLRASALNWVGRE